MRIDSDAPKSVAVGEPSPKFVINAVTTANATLTQIARSLGVKTIEGTVDAKTTVIAPQGNTDVTVHLAITRATVPASGPAEAEATGTAPTRTFSQPGNAKITGGDFILHLDPKNASGTSLLPTPATVPCKVDAEQNKVLASFDITAARTTTSSRTTGTTTSGAPRPPASGTAESPTDGTPSSTTSGPPGTTALTNSTATGKTTTGGQGTRDLILLAVSALVAGAAAFFVFFGSRLKNHRRATDDG